VAFAGEAVQILVSVGFEVVGVVVAGNGGEEIRACADVGKATDLVQAALL